MLFSAITLVNSVRAAVPTALMVGVAPTVLVAHTSWRILSLPFPKKWFYPVEDAIWGWYQKVIVFYFEQCTGTEIKIHGKIPDTKENVIMICNHQTTMDWIVADFVALRQGMVGNMRFVFKNILKYFPIYGYVWGVHGGIFVTRDGTYNTQHMRKCLQKLINREVPLYLVIFPEGTRYASTRKKLLAKSHDYAMQKRVRPLTHVLTPRIKAFYCGIDCLKNYITAVNDVTIIYEERNIGKNSGHRPEKAPSMWEILSGKCKGIHIIFDRIPINKIPIAQSTDTPTFNWLHERFQLKDKQLKSFYNLKDGVQSYTMEDKRSFDEKYPMQEMPKVSFLETGISTLTLTSLTALMLLNKEGRKLYSFTVVGGTFICWIYAKLFI